MSMKTNWTKDFTQSKTLRLKPEDVTAFERAAEEDMRTLQDWMRIKLRAAAGAYYETGNRPPPNGPS